MLYVIVFVAVGIVVFNILWTFDVFSSSRGAAGSQKDFDKEKKNRKRRDREKAKLELYSSFTDMFKGLVLPDSLRNEHQFIIDRLEIRSTILNRFYTPEELCGRYLIWLFTAVVMIPLGLFANIFWAFGIVFAAVYFMYMPWYRMKIAAEDRIIEVYFIDMYLLMYSKLKMHSKGRLHDVVKSYIATLEVSSNIEMRDVMMRLAQFLQNNLSMYTDDVAVMKLRDRYHSPVVTNFCNYASQALQGIQNDEVLFSFRVDLVQKKVQNMEQKSRKMRERGSRAIYLIYIILFIFIAVGWYSKLPTGLF